MVWVCWWKNIIRLRTAPPVWKVNECYRMRLLYSEQSLLRLTATFRELSVSSPPPGCQAACWMKTSQTELHHIHKHLFTCGYRNSHTTCSFKLYRVFPQSAPAMDYMSVSLYAPRHPPPPAQIHSGSPTLQCNVFGGGAFRKKWALNEVMRVDSPWKGSDLITRGRDTRALFLFPSRDDTAIRRPSASQEESLRPDLRLPSLRNCEP